MTTVIKERPILFSAPMVRAILEGRKTQTRRVINFDTVTSHMATKGCFGVDGYDVVDTSTKRIMRRPWTKELIGGYLKCPYGVPGDRLWVRETFAWDEVGSDIHYRADYTEKDARECFTDVGERWRPSIHMPRWASRILLEVTTVRVERVQEIGFRDCQLEGL